MLSGLIKFVKFLNRCFKVVPVPGVFNRGRWECYDFIEGEDNTSETKENNDLLATEKNSASVPTNSTTTNVSAETINVVAIDNKIEQAMVNISEFIGRINDFECNRSF